MEHRLNEDKYELSDAQKLVIAQALFKACGKLVDTKDPDSLRAAVDAEYTKRYNDSGAKTYDISLNGEKVATYSAKFSKETPEKLEHFLNVDNQTELWRWFSDVTGEELREYVSKDVRAFAEWKWKNDGEIAYGCSIQEMHIPGAKPELIGWMLKVDAQKVADVLPPGVRGLLGGGDEQDY
jgi:hypothetical protein